MGPRKVKTTPKLQIEDLLSKIFTNVDNPAAYSSFENIYREARKQNKDISRNDVRNELEKSRTYTLHKPRRKKFRRLKTVPVGFMTDMQADLADFQKVSHVNDEYRYLLVCVDVLSRMIFVAPTHSKASVDMKVAFDKILQQTKTAPLYLFTDKGVEFEAKEMHKYFKKHTIQKFVAQSPDVKASMAERTIKTIKSRLSKYFTQTESYRWVDVVPKIVNGINHSVNRTTKMRPVDVNTKNAFELWNKLYLFKNPKKYNYKKGDFVRIAKEKGDFEKGYLPNYTHEVFKIDRVKGGKVPNYRLVDAAGEKILGKFYEPEFSKSKVEPSDMVIVEKILKERKREGKTEYLIKWQGMPLSKATWIVKDYLFDI